MCKQPEVIPYSAQERLKRIAVIATKICERETSMGDKDIEGVLEIRRLAEGYAD